jgi:cellulose 1,4-beta-cellobiosidase
MLSFVILSICLSLVLSQNIGTNTAENHPALTVQQCTSKNNCQSQPGFVVIDSNWRWIHNMGGTTNCYTGNTWDQTLCPDPATCTKNCALDGADYQGTYGVTTSGNALNLKFVTNGPFSKNIGSRLYLLQDASTYKIFKLKNREFTFTVDISNLPCGLNGALYFVEMAADGGMSKFPTNKCGAKYGTGYCDAQCPHDLKWINGQANVKDWKPSPNDPNSGTGFYGTCCTEMDIWESNAASSAVTPHVCTVQGQTQCSGTQCGDMPDHRYDGVCDKDGCDFNSWRMGNQTFFGPHMTVDTSKPFTVVTQFVTNDGTDRGTLSKINRIYVQNGVVIQNSETNFNGLTKTNSISDQFCNDQKTFFGDRNDFEAKGGLKSLGSTWDRGMVLVLSLWDDHDVHMLWLDSDYPTTSDPTKPGISRGPCATSSGVPGEVESQYPNSNVIYSNIKYGPINTTF